MRGIKAFFMFVVVVLLAIIAGVALLNLVNRFAGGTIIGAGARKVEDLTQPSTGLFAG